MTRLALLRRKRLALIAAVIRAPGIPLAGPMAAIMVAPPAALAAPGASPTAGGPISPAVIAKPASPNAAARPGTPAAGAASAPSAASNLEPLAVRNYTGVLGKKIIGPDGKELGLVVDVLVDVHRRPRAAVIDFGGFLGVGSRKIAVDWRLLKLTPGQPDWQISLNLGRAEIQGAPEYKADDPTDKMVGPPKASPPPAIDK